MLVYVRGYHLAAEVGNRQRDLWRWRGTSMTKEEHKKVCLEERIVRNGQLLKSWLIYRYRLYIAVMNIRYMRDVCCTQIVQEAWLAFDESQLRACKG